MQLLGVKDGVEKPIIKANGQSIVAVMIENAVGEMTTCQFQIPPELATSFTPGATCEITISSKSANGTLFSGRIMGRSFSNVTGNINCRIDLVHSLAYDLDSSSTLFPGNMPGSATDNEAYIKASTSQSYSNSTSGGTVLPLRLNNDFVSDVKVFLGEYIAMAAPASSTGMTEPYGAAEIMSAIGKIEGHSGQIINAPLVESGLSERLNQILKNGDTSTTFWNVLSNYFSELDLVIVCKDDGGLMVLPNMSGIKSQGQNVPTGWVVQFDQSSKYDRTPKEVYVLVSDIPPRESTGMQVSHNKVGHAVIESAPPTASGQFAVEAPPFLRSMTLMPDGAKEVMDNFAKTVGVRETAAFMTCNLTCPLVMGVFPGVGVTFNHLSNIKSFTGGKISAFDSEFDGYCWKIRHEISADGFPKTIFYMNRVTDGLFEKPSSHPFWTGYTIPSW
jgi:hypothetical protein